jgi:predicted MPP superfamily phosphohydrolase
MGAGGRLLSTAAAAGLAAAGWGAFEAGWVRYRTLPLPLPRLPGELSGLRIVHLSDFHLGVPSRGEAAVRAAVDWTVARRPDLVAITGDLVARPGGEPLLRRLLERLPGAFAILGNHDLAISRDPFARPVDLGGLEPAILLLDRGETVQLRGCSVWVAGLDPVARDVAVPPALFRDADLRILLGHFPEVLGELPEDTFDLVLAGHMHGGQICLPYPGGRVRLAHPRAGYQSGVYRRGTTVMHVSPGLGTTFVPFRLFARPEATELVLERAA